MKNIIFLLLGSGMVMIACQKPLLGRTVNLNAARDSTIITGDTLTYEVITSDTVGWFGVWNQPGGILASNVLDSITYGSPVYFPGGWRYTFISPPEPFQALISTATHIFSDDITVNLYRNGMLIKSSKNDAMKGVAKLLVNVNTDTLKGTAINPVLTYEVLVSEGDTSKFEPDAWIGHWINAHGIYNDIDNPLLTEFAIPSGWRYSFKPDHLPFTMGMQASPYTNDGGKVTVNFFVNGQLVKSSSSRGWLYDMRYTVQ